MARTADTGDETRPGTGPADDGTGGKVATRPAADVAAGPRTGLRRLWPGSTMAQHALLMLLAFLGVMLLIETVPPFRVSQLASMAFYVPAVAGLTLLTGINGQISLGHGGLMAVAGYTTAYLLGEAEGLPFVVVLLAALAMTALVGVVVGAAASRLHGPYLAGATLAFAVGLPGLALYYEDQLGGEQGLRVSPPDAPAWFEDVMFFLTGADMGGTKYLAYLGWILALVVLFLLSNLLTSRYGRLWRAVRDDEVAAELAGIDLGRTRVIAFVVSAVCAGVAGVMLAVVTRLVAPTSFTVTLSIFLLVAIVIGGLGSLVGALLGSALLVFLVPFVTDRALAAGLNSAQAANFAPLVFGLFLIVVMLAAPQGVVGTIRTRWAVRSARRRAAAG